MLTELQQLRNEVTHSRRIIQSCEEEIVRLRLTVKELRLRLYSSKRGESIDRDQLELDLKTTETTIDTLQAIVAQQADPPQAESDKPETATATDKEPKIRRRYVFPEDIEEQTETVIPEQVQSEPEAYEEIGEPEVTELLDIVPMKFIKRRIIHPRFKRKTIATARLS